MNQYQLRVLVCGLLVSFTWFACSSPTQPSTDSESHFLSPCDSDADCRGDYQCICSLCTKSCSSSDECTFGSSTVACVDPSASPFDTVCGVDTDGPDGVCLLDCDIDSDCSVLGSRYICESSVCVAASISGDYFNLPDSGNSDATSADWGDDLDMHRTDTAIDSSDMHLEDTVEVAPDVSSTVTISVLDLATEGSDTGEGDTDYHIESNTLSIHEPFHAPTDCSGLLSARQLQTLEQTAAAVDWASLETTYVNPDNPDCCCDQVASDFSITLSTSGGDISASTSWCTETFEDLPDPFVALLSALETLGDEIMFSCEQRERCEPTDAVFEVYECDRFWGYVFDGVECSEVVGYCECTGDDCETLPETLDECTAATADCGYTDIELDLDTDVGFTGLGSTDVHVHSGDVDVHDPFHDPTDCSSRLTATQRDRLLTAAARVDWAGVDSSYIRPDNPYCCCDQFVYDFSVALTANSGSIVRVSSEWCDESFFDDRMPTDFLEFIGVVNEVGDEVLATCGPMPEDCAAAETAEAFLSAEELEAQIEADGPGEFWVEALMFSDDASCSESCDCSISVGPKTDSAFYGLEFITDDRIPGCGASDCELFGFCDTPYPGEWARLQLSGPIGETTQMNLLSTCPVESTPRPDAVLLWQAPAGFAGTGPAIEVTRGQIRLWETASYTPPDDLEPDAIITTSSQATDELFERWARAEVSSLPHEPDEPGADCYPTVSVRLCSDCDVTEIDYRHGWQLEPEMDEVFEWFDAILGVASDLPASPRSWCDF